MSNQREKTVTWEDTSPNLERMAGMSGLEFIRAIRDGDLVAPPISRVIGFNITEAEPGRVVFSLKPTEMHLNPIGSVHGGVFGTLLDSAMSCALQTELKPGEGYTTAEYKINMIRALTPDSPEVFAEGRVISRGRRLGVAEGDIRDASGKIYAHGSATLFIMPLK